MGKNKIVNSDVIQKKIATARELQVMLDSDLAEFYGVETRTLNQAVKRNIERFPKDFMFQLTKEEAKNLMSQFVTSSSGYGGRRKLPYVFTEQGVAMLSAVLKSETAVKMSILIMNAFVVMRKQIASNAQMLPRLESLEKRQMKHEMKTDQKFERVFKALENGDVDPKQGIFFEGQVFDAYIFVSDRIRKAKKSIVLIDNYVDDSVLTLFIKRKKGVSVEIFTKVISKQLALDLKKHNEQYPEITIKEFKGAHDRFIILDRQDVYHIGASLKDLGKKMFAFSKLDKQAFKILEKL
ncbi:ORF6N domain-containing protein [Candidatus Omnitrophota bacterium]